jgi:hypothetical protein
MAGTVDRMMFHPSFTRAATSLALFGRDGAPDSVGFARLQHPLKSGFNVR